MSQSEWEIEALTALYPDVEVSSDANEVITIKHKIRTLQDEATSASVCITCRVACEYPAIKPEVSLSNPRAINETNFERLKQQVADLVASDEEECYLTAVFQLCSDFLLENQHSEDIECSICMCPISDHPVHVTACDHHIHVPCFARHLQISKMEIVTKLEDYPPHMHHTIDQKLHCPVCREVVEEDEKISELLKTSRRRHRQQHEKIDKSPKIKLDLTKWREEQKKLAVIFQRQKQAGGIIDEEENRRKLFLPIETTPTPTTE